MAPISVAAAGTSLGASAYEAVLTGLTANTCNTITLTGVTAIADDAALIDDDNLQVRNLQGDSDNSGNTDIVDLSLTKSALFGPVIGEAETDAHTDGILDIVDLSVTKGNLFETVSCP